MIIFGHRFIKNKLFYKIDKISDIDSTPPSATIYLEFNENNLNVVEYLNKNGIYFAIKINNITEAIYASSLNASYILVTKDLSKTIQDIANNYLFDSKILAMVDNEADIEKMALVGVDGVIFPDAIIDSLI